MLRWPVEPYYRPGRCRECFLPGDLCICAMLPTLPTRTQLIIVRHGLEAFRPTNTARLAALMMPRCRIVDYAVRDLPFELPDFDDDTRLLFPDGEPTAEMLPPPTRLVVLDGTWSQARKMAHRIPQLRTLKRLVLPAPATPLQRLRTPPHPEGMSTLEAIARALEVIEGAQAAEKLVQAHALFVERSIASRGR